METLLQTLTDIQPLIMLSLLLVFWIIESFIPWFSHAPKRSKHSLHNLGMTFISLVFNAITGLGLVLVFELTEKYNLGLLNQFSMNTTLLIVAGIILIDFWDYGYHILTHKWEWMWRFHRVHHSDPHLDSTSSFRFHPFEIIFQTLNWTIMLVVLGIPAASFIIYFTFFIGLIILQHVNVKFPPKLDYYLSFVFSTPEWHKMHHASDKRLTDSHYGDMFTFWDRIFGTGGKPDVEHIEYGLEDYRDEKHQTVKSLLMMPFKPLREKS